MVKEFLAKMGFSEKKINYILNLYPISEMKEETILRNIKDSYSFCKALGFSTQAFIKANSTSNPMFTRPISSLENKVKELEELGFSKNNITKIIKMCPSILGYSIDTIRNKIYDLYELGFDRTTIFKMLVDFPPLITYSIDNIKTKKNMPKTLDKRTSDVVT